MKPNRETRTDLLARLFKDDGNRLRRMIASMARPEDADDVFQEVYLRVQGMDGLHDIADIRSYMFVIAKNIVIDMHRTSLSRIPHENDVSTIADDAGRPDDAYCAGEAIRLLDRALSRLPDMRRKVFLMHRVDCLSYREISDELGTSVTALRQHVARAVRDCRSYVAEAHRRTGRSGVSAGDSGGCRPHRTGVLTQRLCGT